MRGQQLSPGAVVTITGRTLYTVTEVRGAASDPDALVVLRSESSGRRSSARVRSLFWPDSTRPRGIGRPVVTRLPRPVRRQPRLGFTTADDVVSFAAGLGIRFAIGRIPDVQALWIPEHGVLVVDAATDHDTLLRHLEDVLMGDDEDEGGGDAGE